jgi:hypothetical protein
LQVFVKSTDPDTFDPDSLKQSEDPARPLPRRTHTEPQMQHPFTEKHDAVPTGKLRLDDAQEMLVMFKPPNPDDRLNHEALAKLYGIAVEDAAAVTEHFAVFNMWTATDRPVPVIKDPLLPQPDWVDAPEKPMPGERKKLPPPK